MSPPLSVLEFMESEGVRNVSVGRRGVVDCGAILLAVRTCTVLLCMSLANKETGGVAGRRARV